MERQLKVPTGMVDLTYMLFFYVEHDVEHVISPLKLVCATQSNIMGRLDVLNAYNLVVQSRWETKIDMYMPFLFTEKMSRDSQEHMMNALLMLKQRSREENR